MRYRLRRRGVDHGSVTPVPRATSWEAAEPVPLPGIVPIPEVTSTARLLDRLRRGVDLAPLLPPLPRGFRIAGTTQNVQDSLELQKVHVAASGREL
ncbi:MAG TPA: hypothetical protein VGK61_00865, partial [Planctomycetota bacterium]